MKRRNFLLTIFCVFGFTICDYSLSDLDENQKKVAYLDGDFIIGALFPVHVQPKSAVGKTIMCGNVRDQYGIQRVEAALWVVNQINRDKNILKNFTLGIEIRDSCWNTKIALRQALKFVDLCPQDSWSTAKMNSTERKKQVIGVIGPASSEESIEVQNILQIFRIPQIGYSSTTPVLNDRNKYEYFFRVLPPDNYQALAMVSILREFDWTYINVVYSEGSYGNGGKHEFENSIGRNICIVHSNKIGENTTMKEYQEILQKFKEGKRAKVIVCFCDGEGVTGLLRAIKCMNITGYFVIVSSDGWGGRNDIVQKGLENQAQGHIIIRPHTSNVIGFDKYYFDLYKRINNSANPWLEEFWKNVFNCSFEENNGTKKCTGEEQLSANFIQDPKLPFVVKSIYAFAYALQNFIEKECSSGATCDKLLYAENSKFLEYVRNVSFSYENEIIKLDKNDQFVAKYDILNYQEVNGSYNYYTIGSWTNHVISLNVAEIQLPNYAKKIKSVCSDVCKPGEKMVSESVSCCWMCANCSSREISNGVNCTGCDASSIPNAAKTECVKPPLQYPRWDSVEGIICISVSVVGILITLSSFTVYYRFRHTPLVRLSSTELCYIMFCGMILLYSCTFIFLAKPSLYICVVRRLLPGISLTAMFGALLLKTSRISKILTCSKKRFPKLKHKYVSLKFQLFACCGFILVEAAICTFHIRRDPAEAKEKLTSDDKLILHCSKPENELIVPYVFTTILLLFCTYYAFKTRNLPDYFNEAKFIAFSCYATVISWVAFIFIYINDDSQIMPACLTLDITAFINLSCLFVPKLYIILLRPEKNQRRFIVTTEGLRHHFGSVESVQNNIIARNVSSEVSNLQPRKICLLENNSG